MHDEDTARLGAAAREHSPEPATAVAAAGSAPSQTAPVPTAPVTALTAPVTALTAPTAPRPAEKSGTSAPADESADEASYPTVDAAGRTTAQKERIQAALDRAERERSVPGENFKQFLRRRDVQLRLATALRHPDGAVRDRVEGCRHGPPPAHVRAEVNPPELEAWVSQREVQSFSAYECHARGLIGGGCRETATHALVQEPHTYRSCSYHIDPLVDHLSQRAGAAGPVQVYSWSKHTISDFDPELEEELLVVELARLATPEPDEVEEQADDTSPPPVPYPAPAPAPVTLAHYGPLASGPSVGGGRYALLERLAAGGMGVVWRGQDVVLGREVAVKIVRPEFADVATFRARLQAEARNTAGLHHPGIPQVFDLGAAVDWATGRTSAYLVMELVPGEPLSAILQRAGALDPAAAADVVAQAAAAVEAAHRRRVVHRDLKPANLIVTPDGAVKVTDFGIARAADAAPLTQTGQVIGTPHYLSPEQARGAPATPASDVYALGVVLYECLTGRRPFTADDAAAVVVQHLHEPVPALPDSVPADLAGLCRRCLAKDPRDRVGSAGELARVLRETSWAPHQTGG